MSNELAISSCKEYSLKSLDSSEEWVKDNSVNALSLKLVDQARTVVNGAFKDEHIYPAIAFCGTEELTLYWKANDTSLEIDFDEEGFYVATKWHGEQTAQLMGDFKDFPYQTVTEFLDKLTSRVESVNPEWRKLFPTTV